jgi:hypothetical protein
VPTAPALLLRLYACKPYVSLNWHLEHVVLANSRCWQSLSRGTQTTPRRDLRAHLVANSDIFTCVYISYAHIHTHTQLAELERRYSEYISSRTQRSLALSPTLSAQQLAHEFAHEFAQPSPRLSDWPLLPPQAAGASFTCFTGTNVLH